MRYPISNNQLSSGSKAEVASRCAECQLLGGYPRCPLCNSACIHEQWLFYTQLSDADAHSFQLRF